MGSVANAEGPIFFQKMKSKFTNTQSSKTKASPVSTRTKVAKNARSASVVSKQSSNGGNSRADLMAKRRAALSSATVRKDKAASEMSMYREIALAAQQDPGNAGLIPGRALPPVLGANGQPTSSAPSVNKPDRVIIKNGKGSGENSSAPKPIFRNFR
jgi:hypothetical protein